MAIKFFCPSGHRLSAPESQAGRAIRCPACKQMAIVPRAGVVDETTEPEPARQTKPAKRPPVPPRTKARAEEEPGAESPGGVKPPVLQPRPAEAAPKPPKIKLATPAPAPPEVGPPRAEPVPREAEVPLAEPAASESQVPVAKPVEPKAASAGLEVARPLPKPPPPKLPVSKPPPTPSSSSADPPLAEPVEAPEAQPTPARDRRRHGRRNRRRREEPRLRPVKEEAGSQAQQQEEAREPKPLCTLAPRWAGRWGRGPKVMGPHVYQPDRGRVQNTQWLALILAGVVLFSVGPALMHLNIETGPGWARAVLLIGSLQIAFVLWMLATPDWASVWVVMLVFGFAATVYAVGAAVALATPLDEPMPLGMGAIRDWAAVWFTCVLAVQCLATYLCGRAATRWRHMFRLEMAGRGAPSTRPDKA